MRRIFVYGTLRRGERGHHMLAGAAFVGTARSAPIFTMVSLGEYPALREGGRTAIVGELYDVDQHTLALLDEYEEAPEFYLRVTVVIANAAADVYVLPHHHVTDAPVIPSGDWLVR